MKRKIVFVVLCVALLLLFTSSSHGWRLNAKPEPAELFKKPLPSQLEDSARRSGHAWQDIPLFPSGSGTSGGDLPSVRNPEDVTTLVPIRFGGIDFFFIQRRGRGTSDKNLATVSDKR